MGKLIRLRILLADVPGSLARVTAIIAEHGDITAIDLQQVAPSSAVADITAEVHKMGELTPLRRSLRESGAVRLVSHQIATPVDPVVGVLRRLVSVLKSSSYDRDEELKLGVAELCAVPSVWVSSPEDAARYLAGRLALERHGGAVVVRTAELPAAIAATFSGKAWLLAVTDPSPALGQRVVFVARPSTQEFSTTETSRIEALMAVHEQVEVLLGSH